MDVYTTEEQQVEEIKKWWQENGKAITTGIVIGLACIFGWRSWQAYQIEQVEAASVLYKNLTVAVRDNDASRVSKIASTILSQYNSTEYAVFSKLALAKLAVDGDKLDEAADHLRWALSKTRIGSLAHEIRLRLVDVLIAQNKLAEALTLLEIQDRGEFASSYEELKGDVLIRQGDIEAARNAYQLALTKAQTGGLDVSGLETKMDNLGRISSQ